MYLDWLDMLSTVIKSMKTGETYGTKSWLVVAEESPGTLGSRYPMALVGVITI